MLDMWARKQVNLIENLFIHYNKNSMEKVTDSVMWIEEYNVKIAGIHYHVEN